MRRRVVVVSRANTGEEYAGEKHEVSQIQFRQQIRL